MTTVYKVTLMVIDHDNLGQTGVQQAIELAGYANRCIRPVVIEADAREVEWADSNPLNSLSERNAAFCRLFCETPPINQPATTDSRQPICPVCHGAKYVYENLQDLGGQQPHGLGVNAAITCPFCHGKGTLQYEDEQ